MERVLFAVLGVSPSVLTETVWALAHSAEPLIPDHIVVLTTTVGRQALSKALFNNDCGWQRLVAALSREGHAVAGKLRFGLAADHVRLFPAPDGASDLADLVTSADNLAAADFILRELRSFTESPDTEVLASIAGGRKTMSAMLMACMSLLGRSQDRVLHVLVNAPFDTPLDPPFLFPEAKVKHRGADGRSHASSRALIELIDVPFVRMRGWYEGAFRATPPGYAALVAGVQQEAPPPMIAPQLSLDHDRTRLLIDRADYIALSAPETAVLSLYFRGVTNHSTITEELLRFKGRKLSQQAVPWWHDFQASERYYDDSGALLSHLEAISTTRRLLSGLRAKLRRHPVTAPFVAQLLPTREAATTYGKLSFSGRDPFPDIRGYPV